MIILPGIVSCYIGSQRGTHFICFHSLGVECLLSWSSSGTYQTDFRVN